MILTIICTENYIYIYIFYIFIYIFTYIFYVFLYIFKLHTYKYILPETVAGLTSNYYY